MFLSCFVVAVAAMFVVMTACNGGSGNDFDGITDTVKKQRADNHEHVFNFVHLSDIHTSKYHPDRGLALLSFVQNELPKIHAEFVIVTGDLTDAKDEDHFFSIQNEEEWQTYEGIVKTVNETLGIPWLDIRGNHDGFNVPSRGHSDDYFSRHSSSGLNNRHDAIFLGVHSHVHQPSTSNNNNSVSGCTVIAIDATPSPGPKRPYNFFGSLSDEAVDRVKSLAQKSNNNVIVAGHYPLSMVWSNPSNHLSTAIQGSAVHLCGHLHNLAGFAPKFYAKRGDLLELELTDFKDNRMVRIASLDGGALSFVDFRLGESSVLLITWPPDLPFRSNNVNWNPIEDNNKILVRGFFFDFSSSSSSNDNDDDSTEQIRAEIFDNGSILGSSELVIVDKKRNLFQGFVTIDIKNNEDVSGKILSLTVTMKRSSLVLVATRDVGIGRVTFPSLPSFPAILLQIPDYHTFSLWLIRLAVMVGTLPVWFGLILRYCCHHDDPRNRNQFQQILLAEDEDVSAKSKKKKAALSFYQLYVSNRWKGFCWRCAEISRDVWASVFLCLPFVWILTAPLLVGVFVPPDGIGFMTLTTLYLPNTASSIVYGDPAVLLAIPKILFCFFPMTMLWLLSPTQYHTKNQDFKCCHWYIRSKWTVFLVAVLTIPNLLNIKSNVAHYGLLVLCSPLGLLSVVMLWLPILYHKK